MSVVFQLSMVTGTPANIVPAENDEPKHKSPTSKRKKRTKTNEDIGTQRVRIKDCFVMCWPDMKALTPSNDVFLYYRVLYTAYGNLSNTQLILDSCVTSRLRS